ncbi:ABA4-like family protein [Oscillatoria sp. CS-180]|uniref:ABA4-like family protein n=1 Tax=Oscillatoria sp. CS-180 TaxID=3021720 RepID=UPI00232E376D|nr:ABA4-like family protein [Oscillatoria sp. CS-180]MDB9529829.1 ABA4-like family protein [Oscillatoria sp. CS-180]
MFMPTPDDLDRIFQVSNLFVLPFWALMIVLPNWSLTQRVMQSYIPFAALASLYVYLFATLDGSILEAFSDPQLELSSLAGMFANSQVMATGWTHFLVMDLFVGRWIYQQGQEKGIFTRHSLAFCLFAGPLGLLSHFLTDAIAQRFFQSTSDSTSSEPSAV